MESNIDLSILKKLPEVKTQAVLSIRPLAPLSMVSELPGSFYKTMKYPSKKMLCGLFENMLGWHFDNKLRLKIFKDMPRQTESHLDLSGDASSQRCHPSLQKAAAAHSRQYARQHRGNLHDSARIRFYAQANGRSTLRGNGGDQQFGRG